MTKPRIMQTTHAIAQGLLFSIAKNLGQIPTWSLPMRATNRGGVG